MNSLTAKSAAGFLAAICVMASPCVLASSAESADGPVTVLTNLQFSSALQALGSTTVGLPGWSFGSQNGGLLSVAPTTPPPLPDASSFALKASYPAAGTGSQYLWANFNVSALNTEDIYIEFWAKMPNAKGGCKFLKIFGKKNDPQGYADMTLGMNYTGPINGGIVNMEYGDGTSTINDAQNTIFLDGSHPQWMGRSYGTASVLTPVSQGWPASNWGTGWHHFRIHVKFNSGTTTSNAVPDGEVYVEIDGKRYIDATGLFDRNPANGPIDYIQLGGWSQTNPQAFDLWYDDITVSTGGFVADANPMPPGHIAAR